MMGVKIRVRLLDDPILWCWELVDPSTGAVRETSWASAWEAYGSAEEALRAASTHLGASIDPPEDDAA